MYELWALVWSNIEGKKEEDEQKGTLKEAMYNVGGKNRSVGCLQIMGGMFQQGRNN